MEKKQPSYNLEYQEPKIEEIKRIRFDELDGLFQTSSSVPTHVPRKFSEQIVIYTSGATYRLYWYDNANGAWRYSVGV